MTEKEAIEILETIAGVYKLKEVREAMNMAISALEESRQYRAIGTVEKCREAMSRYMEHEKMAKCEECIFLEERKPGKGRAISGICRIKPQNGRRYGKSRACRFFERTLL